ncbi:MAG TPA: phospholipase D-like domain-containing protein [Ktedonobacterales bacterium]|nr:phospholipase D-like domain-containing protein [Ktedonobacterales bacterium]
MREPSDSATRQRRLLRVPSRHLIVRLFAAALAVMVSLQAVTIAVLTAVDKQRKHRSAPAAFPHNELPEIAFDSNTFQIYTYGRDVYDAMLAAIDAATESIYFETFIWKDDAVGQEFKEHLARKAEQGVAVYVVFDVFGNLVVPREFKQFPASVHTLRYRAIHRPRHLLMPRRYALDHRKLLIVDGQVAFIGGYNIGSLYATEWRDTHLRITGSDAAFLAQAFVDFWNRNAPHNDLIGCRYKRRYNFAMSVRSNDAMRLTFPIRDMYLTGIDAADQRIRLTSAYFIPDHVLLTALKSAAARGVDVQVLVPWTSNHIIADWASHAYFTECLRGGIRIFGYQNAMIHAKTCTVDGQATTIGTANIDRLSTVGNYEINTVIFNAAVAEQMERIFEADKTNAFELTLEQWRSRPWYVKASERVIKPLRFVL